jgi:levansucrase
MKGARWTRRHVGRLVTSSRTTAPAVDGDPPPRLLAGSDLWDLWPVQDQDGSPSVVQGRELWMALSAPALGHPEDRHDVARLRLLALTAGAWSDLGHVFADGSSPGSREWSGSAVRHRDGTVSVYYTAAGRRGEAAPSYVQRVIEARSELVAVDGRLRIRRTRHEEVVRPDGRTYLHADETDGTPGRIRAFRDPGWFRDPKDGRNYLLIAASVPWRGRFTGAVAIAVRDRDSWSLQPPLLQADGISHELERPHIVVAGARYYLFFSAQRHSFHPPQSAPTGLYGFVASDLSGPWEPLNGSGLVIQNPPSAPDQAYAWLVLHDLRVVSFLNYRSPAGGDLRRASAENARAGFGGTLAPTLHLALDGSVTSLVVAPAAPSPTR